MSLFAWTKTNGGKDDEADISKDVESSYEITLEEKIIIITGRHISGLMTQARRSVITSPQIHIETVKQPFSLFVFYVSKELTLDDAFMYKLQRS